MLLSGCNDKRTKENFEKEFEEFVRNGEVIVDLIDMYEACEKSVSSK